VYSLACVLYEMLAGDPPHVASTAQAVLAKILTEEAPEVGTRRKAVPPNVEAALAKGLERLPADRFATAAAFAGALADPGYRDASSAARPALGAPSGPPRAAPWALAAALGALAAWSLLVGSGSEDAPVLRYALELPEGADLAHIEDSGRRFALAPDGSWLAWIAQGPAASRVWVRSRDRVEARPLEGTDNALELFAGPYGERIGVRVSFREDDGAQSQIFLLVPIEGGAPARLSRRGMMRSLAGVSWSDDGYLYWDVANFRGPSGIGRTPEDGGEDELVTRLDTASGEWDARSPMALPEGGGLLFTRAQEGEADVIVALDAEGRQTVVVEGRDAVYVHPGALAWVTEGGTLMAAPFDVRTFRITGPPVALDEGLALVGAAGYELAASREGTLAYVKGEPGPSPSRIAWVGRDGREEPVPLEWKGRVGSLSLSPDGRQVAFAGGTAIVIKDLETGAETPLTFDDANFSNPRWSSDGRSIVYAKNRTLREMDASGLGEERHLLGTGISGDLVFFGEWSPDRSWLVWNSGGMLNVRAAADTARRVRLPGEGSGRISPDGAWLATTGEGLMVRPFPDVEQGARQVSATGENPIWSRDGSELFYWDRETGALIAAEVLSGETFRVGARDTLFRGIPPSSAGQAGGFDVAPDGRFLVTRRGAPPRQSLMFIENLPRLVREAGANR
jgi:serine/threonine-protein kinase